jgi:uncharacterized SAM-binding protein YcdF (DUF218 family)
VIPLSTVVFYNFLKSLLRFDAPLTCIVALTTVAIWWWRRPSSPAPRRLLVALLVVFYLASTPIGATVLVAGLSHGLTSIASRADARGADAVVILSGGVESVRTAGVVLTELSTASALRVLEGARVYKLIGARLAIVSGGIADERAELQPEAEHMAEALVKAGVPRANVALDLRAKDTRDHPRTIRPILEANGVRQFVIVTSPTHMRRALAVFRAAGFNPVGSVSLLRSDHLHRPPLFLPNGDSLLLSDESLYDYSAWIYYWARGRL